MVLLKPPKIGFSTDYNGVTYFFEFYYASIKSAQ